MVGNALGKFVRSFTIESLESGRLRCAQSAWKGESRMLVIYKEIAFVRIGQLQDEKMGQCNPTQLAPRTANVIDC